MKITTEIPKNPNKDEYKIYFTSMSSREFENFRCLLHAMFNYGQFDNADQLCEQVSIQKAIIDNWISLRDEERSE